MKRYLDSTHESFTTAHVPKTCGLCGRELSSKPGPALDCGGDCAECMASCGDPDAICMLNNQRKNKLAIKVSGLFFLFFLGLMFFASCSTDYRTDYERNNEIELTPVQEEIRRWHESQLLKAQQKADAEYFFREALQHCHNRTIAECI